MSEESTPKDWLAPLDAEKIYTELCTDIRETDNSSFRLLGLVPLVSGTALIGLMFQKESLPPGLILLLSMFAATITFGLFRWELRNLQTSSWLIKSAYVIECAALESHGRPELFRERPGAPQRIGKTEAEKFIYTVTVLAWLGLPFGVGSLSMLPGGAGLVYCLVAGVILSLTVVSLFAETHVPPFQTNAP